MAIPNSLAWLFPEHDPRRLDLERDARLILARVLEHGRLDDVRCCVELYGLEGIHEFFRRAAHPEVSQKTVALWRGALKAKGEAWPNSRRSELRNVVPWPG